MPTIRLSDFGGGYNTAVDEALLPPNMSASMSNVDITESGGLTRRAGATKVTATPIVQGMPIHSLHRYYQADGDKYWLAHVGSLDATTVIEAEKCLTASTSGVSSYVSIITDSNAHGGSYVEQSGSHATSATYTIPVSDKITMYGVTGYVNFVNASVAIDGGSYVAATTGLSWTGLAATSHTIHVKTAATSPPARAFVDYFEYGLDPTLQYRQDGVTDVQPTLTESESVVSATSGMVTLDLSGLSGGVGLGATALVAGTNTYSATYDIPYSSQVVVGYYNRDWDGSVSGSISIDGGAYYDLESSGGAHTFSFAGLSATTHQVHIKSASVLGQFETTFPSVQFHDFFVYSALSNWSVAATNISASTTDYCYVTASNAVYFGSEYRTLRRFDGTVHDISATAGAPAARTLAVMRERIFAAGKNTDKEIVEYTLTASYDDFAGGGSFRTAGKATGGDTIALAQFKDYLFILAKGSIWAVDTAGDDTDWSKRLVSDEYGCVSTKSVAVAPNGIYFLGPDGVYVYGTVSGNHSWDGSGFINISENIQPTIDALSDDAKAIAAGAFYKNRYWLAVDTDDDGENDTVLVFRLPKGENPSAWVRYDYPFGVSCFCVTRPDEYGLYAGTYDGYVYELDTGNNDGGLAISMSYKTPPMTGGKNYGYERLKHYRHTHISAYAPNTQDLVVTPITDDVSGVAATVSITGTTVYQPLRSRLRARGRSLSLQFDGSGNEQPITINEISIPFDARKVR